MLLDADGLGGRVISASSTSGLDMEPDLDTTMHSSYAYGAFWDCSLYPDFAQTWLENDVFCIGAKNPSLAVASLPFTGTSSSDSSPTLFACQESFPEPSVLRQATFGETLWSAFLSPDLASPVDEQYSTSLVAQGTGKENTHPQIDSPTLNDLAGFAGATSIWADSPSPKFNTNAFINVPMPPHSSASPLHPQAGPNRLIGWGDTSHLRLPNPVPSVSLHQNSLRSPCQNQDDDSVLDPLSPTLDACSPLGKRPRQSTPPHASPGTKSESFSLDSGDEDGSRDEDSDTYQPSCSPSPKFAGFKRESKLFPKRTSRSVKAGKASKSEKSRKKGSAALALAVVTQIGEAKREAQSLQVPVDPDSFDPVRVYHEGGYMVRKRKNQPIPVPVPVPNLNKKSRGRKVPLVSRRGSPVPSLNMASSPSVEDGISGRPQHSTRSRKKVQTVSASDESGAGRTFICVVAGCGKGFVRGEHLKRHVRSIHTNDKPHVCPFEGCDKSFSRRDNLGQHVRVHLQP